MAQPHEGVATNAMTQTLTHLLPFHKLGKESMKTKDTASQLV
jgi:hypothetical protein